MATSAAPGRKTVGGKKLLIISKYYQKGKRVCPCKAKWQLVFPKGGVPAVFKNGVPMPNAILDIHGNNVAVECC